MKTSIRIGTRGSALALYQAELVKTRIENDFPLIQIEIVKIKTSGDMVRRHTTAVNLKSMFTHEIEDALVKGEIDLAVHSAKDMAAELPHGTKIGAALEREDPRDCLISKDKKLISELPLGARIGTSSIRRKMQLLRWNQELIIEEVHGNVDTRIHKMEEGFYDAIVLAYAGIKRLGLANHVAEIFPQQTFYPAPGQGVIAVQSRAGDSNIDEILHPLNHVPTAKRLACERAFLSRLEGGCQLPCGITTELDGHHLKTVGILFATEGLEWAEAKFEGDAAYPEDTGIRLAEAVLQSGGQEILNKIRRSNIKD